MVLIRFLLLLVLFTGAAGQAQTFPPLTGRVVDNANLLDPAQENALAAKLEALERASSRQLVVATIPDLQGYPIEDYGYRLGRTWGIGQKEIDNGVILIVAPNERRVRIEVGYGAEPIVTDILSGRIIREQITPRFKAGDYAGGINAGADALIQQLQAPPEEAERRVVEAQQAQAQQRQGSSDEGGGGGGSIFPLVFWGLIIFFVVLPMLRGGRRGRRYRRGGGFPVVVWGPGLGSGGFGGGGGGGFGGGGFGGGGGGGFGGFSGGGGSFGGGGASGGW
jgi:uncharacterized protein